MTGIDWPIYGYWPYYDPYYLLNYTLATNTTNLPTPSSVHDQCFKEVNRLQQELDQLRDRFDNYMVAKAKEMHKLLVELCRAEPLDFHD